HPDSRRQRDPSAENTMGRSWIARGTVVGARHLYKHAPNAIVREGWPDIDVNGKTAIITGGGSGIGRAVAVLLAHEGASVLAVGRNDANGAETVALIEEAGGKAAWCHADVANAADIDAMFALAEKTY